MECPVCSRKLRVDDTRKKRLDQRSFFVVLDVVDGFQLNRFFEVISEHKAGEAPNFRVWEVVQQWMSPEMAKPEIIARNRGGMGWYQDGFHGDLEIRNRDLIDRKYDLWASKVYPGGKCLPIYKRNGFSGKFGGVTPFELFTNTLKDSYAETLLKTKQFSLLAARIDVRSGSVYRHWPSIKICIRNNYIVKDAITWLDYLDLLNYFGKDLRSAKYVCTPNLKKEHDRLVKKKTEITNRQDLERRKKQTENDQNDYAKSKGVFFGIAFSDADLEVRVLEHVKEFIEEADAHKHCVYSNRYFAKEDSLILSARLNGTPIETVEISLSKMQVVQSRGLQNKATEYHEKILELLNKGLPTIWNRYRQMKRVEAA